MVDILQFYKETTEKAPEDQVLEKFGHAGADRSQYASPNPSNPTSPTMYPTNYMGMQLLLNCTARQPLIISHRKL